MVGTRFSAGSNGSGTEGSAPFACHCHLSAGLLVSSHSNLNRLSKKWLLHFVGVCDQMTSGPPVMASLPKPVPNLLRQPRPWSSIEPPSVPPSATKEGSPAPCV